MWMPHTDVIAQLPKEFSAFSDIQVTVLTDCLLFFFGKTVFSVQIYWYGTPWCFHMSGLHAGSMSDCEIFKLSGITNLVNQTWQLWLTKGSLWTVWLCGRFTSLHFSQETPK